MQNEVNHAAAPIITQGGAGVAVLSAFTQTEWTAIGIIAGILIGCIGLTLQTILFFFKFKQVRLEAKLTRNQLQKHGEENETGIGPDY